MKCDPIRANAPMVALVLLAGCSATAPRESTARQSATSTAFSQPSFEVAGYRAYRVGPSDALSVSAYGLNGSNEVVGSYTAADSSELPFVQRGAGGPIEGLPVPPHGNTKAIAISDNGFIAGISGPVPLRWSPVGEVTEFSYSAFGLTKAINSTGLIVGHTASGCGFGGCTFLPHAWLEAGTRTPLPPPAGTLRIGSGNSVPNQPDEIFGEVANDVNEAGVAVGQSVVVLTEFVSAPRVLLWSARTNTTTDLGDLGAVEFAAAGINERGDIVGARRMAQGQPMKGFVWLTEATATDLPCDLGCTALEINQARQVVGSVNTPEGEHAFVWSVSGGLVDLDARVTNRGQTVLRKALDINEQGSILVQATIGDENASILLVPEPAPSVFWYFRCNASGWGADAHTLMLPTATAGVVSLPYDVTLSWMLNGGDQCLLARTNAQNGWGTEQRFYGVRLDDSVAGAGVRVPDGYPVFATESRYARLVYPALGRYRASLDTTTLVVNVTRE